MPKPTAIPPFLAPLLAALLAAGTPALAQNGPEARAFAADALPKIRAAFPDAEVAQEPGEPLQINITRKSETEPATINLHRVFGFCQNVDKDACEAELTGLIGILAKSPKAPEREAANLRVIVRDGQYWNYVLGTGLDPLPPHRRIGDDLFAILAFDSPEAIALAPADRIAELGLSPENAWLFAERQTARIIPGLPEEGAKLDGLTVFQGEEYTGSMMAYAAQWEALAAANGPDLAVIANSDQFVVAAVVPDGAELEKYRGLAEEQCKLASRCISPNVYRWREGKWVIAR
ncbi:MAG: hypothetical protein NBV68_07105 [Erythrobacter sp.]|uniref:hypothetical protein n=1 Tax=Erythrobacter sp. TaxID=1042 RepID=UPI0025E17314|nr:hypothetical protein [Erythrobacter sp.]MCL9999134.1 hypothetical protein [Erythrobacter sp.]